MTDIRTAPFMREMCQTASNMYRLGWDERNCGNISLMLDDEQVLEYFDPKNVIRKLGLDFDARALAGRFFLVTGTGKYFKNIEADPENNLGIVRVARDGLGIELLWGFEDGGSFTSELAAHLMSHAERIKVNPNNRVIMHAHPAHTLAMNFVHPLEERAVTRTLWKMCTECIVVFPEGVGVLDWMPCGTAEIGLQTAKKMLEYRVVIWGMHGVYGAGCSLDEAFGLIETVEKAAQIYMLTAHLPQVNTITDDQLRALAARFNLPYKKEFLQ